MSLTSLRAVCPHCQAVLECESPVEGMSLPCGACEETFDWPFRDGLPNDESFNTAAPHRSVMREVPAGTSLDSVFLSAIIRLQRHWGVLLAVSLAVNVMWFAAISFPANALAELWGQMTGGDGGDGRLLVMMLGGTLLVGALIAPMSAYAVVALIRIALRIARFDLQERSASTLARLGTALKMPVMPVIRVTVLFIAIGMTGLFFLGIGLIAIVILSLFLEPRTATLAGVFGVGAALISFVFLLQWLLWPAIFLIADERTDLSSGLTWGVRLAWKHRKLALSLVTVYFVLATVGSLLFYVGQVVTTPLALQPMATGYLKMTGGQTRAS